MIPLLYVAVSLKDFWYRWLAVVFRAFAEMMKIINLHGPGWMPLQSNQALEQLYLEYRVHYNRHFLWKLKNPIDYAIGTYKVTCNLCR